MNESTFSMRRFLVIAGVGLLLVAGLRLLGAGRSWTNPPPFPASGLHVLIVKQNADDAARPWLLATSFRDELDKRGAWRQWDADFSDDDLAKADATFSAAFRAAKADPKFRAPWVIWSDGRAGGSIPLPATEAETLQRIGK